ncbi:MAG: hypothetical protein A2Z34_03420 [Planctomycetes bacterium RBG_16_59_8]|nr:MAG: hypothetical protein A2Z34_03420 [Planctomycetes bacterium RBG_16_59_8]
MILFVLLCEDLFIYHPEKTAAGTSVADPIPGARTVEECFFPASDGVRLNAIYVRAGTERRRTLLWFHGNAGNLQQRRGRIADFLAIGVDLFLFDYRGFGKSEGDPSEEGLYLDGLAAYDYLTKVKGVPPEKVIFFGKSLGGAIAVETATKRPCPALIVQSAFTSTREMASVIIPIFPGRWFMKTDFDSKSKIGGISAPKLFIHSPKDEVIPYRLGKELYSAAAGPKEFYEIPDAGHNETFDVGGKAYWMRMKEFIDRSVR